MPISTMIKDLEREVAVNQEALDQITAFRESELAALNIVEKDALQAISALKSAVTVLSKHHDSACVQMPRGHLEGIANTIQYQVRGIHCFQCSFEHRDQDKAYQLGAS